MALGVGFLLFLALANVFMTSVQAWAGLHECELWNPHDRRVLWL